MHQAEMMKYHAYHGWANARLLDHVARTPEVFARVLASPFPTMARMFGHLYDVDRTWFSRMRGSGPGALGETVFAEPAEAKARLGALHASVRDLSVRRAGRCGHPVRQHVRYGV
ncbi:hypothetical protein IDH44_00405 [Paenibacillus sp. IB182496]|uniref:Damage-inducible protein DinB n=1 Tax=Paenibacillus sabuli TaxID=2772509 RepID=A0A927BQE3_9BACL|nr:DinB family protein [Paenibacillus sabuli]MBD2843634.1 hypothetical protein [Paenibacillus sabuli]